MNQNPTAKQCVQFFIMWAVIIYLLYFLFDFFGSKSRAEDETKPQTEISAAELAREKRSAWNESFSFLPGKEEIIQAHMDIYGSSRKEAETAFNAESEKYIQSYMFLYGLSRKEAEATWDEFLRYGNLRKMEYAPRIEKIIRWYMLKSDLTYSDAAGDVLWFLERGRAEQRINYSFLIQKLKALTRAQKQPAE